MATLKVPLGNAPGALNNLGTHTSTRQPAGGGNAATKQPAYNNLGAPSKSMYGSQLATHNSSRRYSTVGSRIGGNKGSRGSRKGKNKHQYQHDVARVFDRFGNDVTPQPLQSIQPQLTSSHNYNTQHTQQQTTDRTPGFTSTRQPLTGGITNALHNQQHPSVQASGYHNNLYMDVSRGNIDARGGHQHYAQQQQHGVTDGATSVSFSNGATTDMANNDYAAKEQLFLQSLQEIQSQHQTQHHTYSEAELKQRISIHLQETDTYVLYTQPSKFIYEGHVQSVARVKEENAYYTDLIADRNENSQQFVATTTQTLNPTVRDKDIQCMPPDVHDMCVGVQTYEIYDTYQQMQKQHEGSGADATTADQLLSDELNTAIVDGDAGSYAGDVAGGSTAGSSSYAPTSTTAPSSPTSVHSSRRSFAQNTQNGGGTTSITASRISDGGESTNASHAQRNSDGGSASHHGSTGAMGTAKHAATSRYDHLTRNSAFRQALSVMEQAILSSTMQLEQLLYRDIVGSQQQLHQLTAATHTYAKDSSTSNKLQTTHNLPSTDDFSSDPDAPPPHTPHLQPLWQFHSPCSSEMNVSALVWNSVNEDLMVVGYSSVQPQQQKKADEPLSPAALHEDPLAEHATDSAALIHSTANDRNGGAVAFWSLKNIAFPHRLYTTTSSVTCMHFSTTIPYLLAVGFYDGNISIYDVRQARAIPILQSTHATGKHREPVMQLKWVTPATSTTSSDATASHKDTTAAQTASSLPQYLVSISTDGSILQWSLKKGVTPSLLMQLKRTSSTHTQQHAGAKKKAQATQNDKSKDKAAGDTSTNSTVGVSLSREASGMCFDFSADDNHSTYIAATEDGVIHKCSVSYNEQTLEAYVGHTAPVYRVAYNVYVPHIFLSASADWSACLWSHHLGANQPIFKFCSGNDAVMDAVWSRHSATVFALCSQQGRIEVWDLQYSSLDPIISININKQLACIGFTPNAPVLLVGAADGTVHAYRIHGVDVLNRSGVGALQQVDTLESIVESHCESQQRLKDATHATQSQAQAQAAAA